jgi:CrcB protein
MGLSDRTENPDSITCRTDLGTAEPMSSGHPIRRIEVLVLVAIGGFAGSNLRYLVDLVVGGLAGTLLVNAAGSFFLGVVLYEAMRSDVLAAETRAVVGTGFLSSFTTYSTFALQSAQAGPALLVSNVVATYALGFAGVLASRSVVDAVLGRWS